VRLTDQQVGAIRYEVESLCGEDAVVQLFGSRLDDAARGGDVDLLVTLPEAVVHPARLSAQLSARISRRLDGRSVDVLLSAPNLAVTSVHQVASRQGVRL